MKKHDPQKQVRILNTRANGALNDFLSAIEFDHSVASQRIHAERFIKAIYELDVYVAQNSSAAERLSTAETLASLLENNPRWKLLDHASNPTTSTFLANWRAAAGNAAEQQRLADEVARMTVAQAPTSQAEILSKSTEELLTHAKALIALAFPDIKIPEGPLVPERFGSLFPRLL